MGVLFDNRVGEGGNDKPTQTNRDENPAQPRNERCSSLLVHKRDVVEDNEQPSCLVCLLSTPLHKVFFNQPVANVRWPEALLELDFGLTFDMPVEGVAFPKGLRSLCFGRSFNQDVMGVAWPEGLLRVSREKYITRGREYSETTGRKEAFVEVYESTGIYAACLGHGVPFFDAVFIDLEPGICEPSTPCAQSYCLFRRGHDIFFSLGLLVALPEAHTALVMTLVLQRLMAPFCCEEREEH